MHSKSLPLLIQLNGHRLKDNPVLVHAVSLSVRNKVAPRDAVNLVTERDRHILGFRAALVHFLHSTHIPSIAWRPEPASDLDVVVL